MKHLPRKLLSGLLIAASISCGALRAVAGEEDPLMAKIVALNPQDHEGIFRLEGTTDGAYAAMWANKIAESFAYDGDACLTALARWNGQRGGSAIGSFLAGEIALYHHIGEAGQAQSLEEELARQFELAKAKADLIAEIQAEIAAQK